MSVCVRNALAVDTQCAHCLQCVCNVCNVCAVYTLRTLLRHCEHSAYTAYYLHTAHIAHTLHTVCPLRTLYTYCGRVWIPDTVAFEGFHASARSSIPCLVSCCACGPDQRDSAQRGSVQCSIRLRRRGAAAGAGRSKCARTASGARARQPACGANTVLHCNAAIGANARTCARRNSAGSRSCAGSGARGRTEKPKPVPRTREHHGRRAEKAARRKRPLPARRLSRQHAHLQRARSAHRSLAAGLVYAQRNPHRQSAAHEAQGGAHGQALRVALSGRAAVRGSHEGCGSSEHHA